MRIALIKKPYINIRAVAINNKKPLISSLARLYFISRLNKATSYKYLKLLFI